MGFTSLFGGGSSNKEPEQKEEGEYIDGYKVATAEDMEWFAKML